MPLSFLQVFCADICYRCEGSWSNMGTVPTLWCNGKERMENVSQTAAEGI